MLRIAVMYEYGSETWSTPWSLIVELQSRNHHVERFHLSEPGISQFMSSDILWDILLVMDWKGLNFQRLDKQYMRKGMWMVSEVADCPQNFDKHLVLADRYHTLLCPAYDSTEKFKSLGYDCEFFTHWADTRIHINDFGFDYYPLVRSTRGKGGSQVMDYLEQIMPDKFINRNGLTGKEYGKFLTNGLITFQHSRWQEITRRIFEGMACGTMVLTDRLPEHTHINDLFTEGEDYVTYIDIPEAISKMNYYRNNSGERERIAHRGYMKTLANHTQINRVDTIIQKYNEWKTRHH